MQNDSTNEVLVRAAKPADAEAIVNTHYAAVHEIASGRYSSEIVDDWSRKPDEARYEMMRGIITQGEEIVVVAETNAGIVGFGIIVPALCEIRALYVQPSVVRTGVGKKILRELEYRAVMQGISHLQLNASLNAETFYQRNGYKSQAQSTYCLSSGREMACIKMDKNLAAI